MAVSQNGWPVAPLRRSRRVPGTQVSLTVADGAAGDVLMYVAAQFNGRVEDIDNARGGLDDWGYAYRPIRGSTETSNHASGTAIDLNATRHPLGVKNTFSHAQQAAIHAILQEVDFVVRWGGDYSGRVDEMHFEINAPEFKVKRVAERLKGGDEMAAGFDTVRRDRFGNDNTYGLGFDYTEERVARLDDDKPDSAAKRKDVGYARDQILSVLEALMTDVAKIKAKLEAK